MKKIIFLIIILFAVIESKSQILRTQAVLYKLQISDINLQAQLDSVLFIDYPCSTQKKYVYLTTIREEKPNIYKITVVYTKPSTVEKDVNTGIYTNNDRIFIVRETSDTSLFQVTSEKEKFRYEKMVEQTGPNSNYLEESLSPFDPCIWVLIYDGNKMEVLELCNVRKANKNE